MKKSLILNVVGIILCLSLCQCSNKSSSPAEQKESETSTSGGNFVFPLAVGNYWVYNGSCSNPPSGLDGTESLDSIGATAESVEGCDIAFQLVSSRGNSSFPQHIELCDSTVRVNGLAWQAEVPSSYFTYTVPAGTFDSCYAVYSVFWSNGQDEQIYAKGIGMIERSQVWYSVHTGDSYHCKASLIRYRIASE